MMMMNRLTRIIEDGYTERRKEAYRKCRKNTEK